MPHVFNNRNIKMLRILLRHWWTISCRTFDWKRLGVVAYFALCMVFGMWMGLEASGNSLSTLFHHPDSMYYIVPLVVGFSVSEVLMKLFLKHDITGSDDYVNTKPISRRTWNSFLFALNLVDYLNWAVPVLVLILACLGLPLGYALLAFALALLVSMTDGLLITAHHKAQGWIFKLVLWLAWLVYYVFAAVFIALLMPQLSPIWRVMVWGFVTLLLGIGIFIYMCYLPHYADYRQQQHVACRLTSGHLLSMDWKMLMRVKRFRMTILLVSAIFVVQVYLNARGNNDGVYPRGFLDTYLLMPIFFPAIIIGQNLLGVESNFLHGLLTRPFDMESLLRRKLLFFIQLNALLMLVLLPGVFLSYWSLGKLLSSFIFSSGCDLFLLPSCLFSQRLDLNSTSFFNYQGGKMSFHLYGLLMLLPLMFTFALYHFLPSGQLVQAILAVIGVVLLSLSPFVIRRLARYFWTKRHQLVETFNQ